MDESLFYAVDWSQLAKLAKVQTVFGGGNGLRQLLDFAVCLNTYFPKLNMDLLVDYLNSLHIRHPFKVLCYVSEHFLGLPYHVVSWEKMQRVQCEGNRLMLDVLKIGNFGHEGYKFKHDNMMGALQNCGYVCGRSAKFFGLCPSEAVMWPVSKMKLFYLKHLYNVSH